MNPNDYNVKFNDTIKINEDSIIPSVNDDFDLISFENIKSKENFNNKCMANW